MINIKNKNIFKKRKPMNGFLRKFFSLSIIIAVVISFYVPQSPFSNIKIAFAASPSVGLVGNPLAGTGAVTPVWPAHVSGDVALLFVESANEAVTLSTPAGFTEIPTAQGTGTAAAIGSTRLTVFWNRATSGAMSNPTVADPGNHVYAQIITFKGVVDTGDPYEAVAGSVKGTDSVTTTFDTVTTSTADDLIVLATAIDRDSASPSLNNWVNSNFVELNELTDYGTAGGVGGGIAVAAGTKLTAGATGTTEGTLVSSITTQMTIALKPSTTRAAEAYGLRFNLAGDFVSSEVGAVTPVWPTHEAGDVALLLVESANEAITLSTPAGFTEIPTAQGTGTAGLDGAVRLTVFWNRATSGAMSNPTVADPGNHVYARIITFKGAITTGDPYEVVAGSVKGTASITTTFDTVTTSTNNDLIVLASAWDVDTLTGPFLLYANSNLTDIAKAVDSGTIDGVGGGIVVATGIKSSAGATGTTAGTLMSSVTAQMTIALKPAPPGTTPTVTTPTQSAVGTTSATLGANVTTDGGSAVTARGTCWATTANPTTNCSTVAGTTGVFTGTSQGTMPSNTLIYYRGYATNAYGTAYSTDDSFTTETIPTLTLPTKTSITNTTATLGATLTSPSFAVTARGTCWDTTSSPTANCLTAGTAVGVYTQARTSLTQGVLIYYRGYATYTDTAGVTATVYGSDDSFTTLTTPTVTTPTQSAVGTTSATLGANVTTDGGSAVTARGTCWATTANPTTNCSTVAGTTGVFTGTSQGTMPSNTLIYYRGYATNAYGTAYSTDDSFTTSSLSTYTQSNYIMFNNLNSLDVGSALASLNTGATLASSGANFRLRALVLVGGDTLAQNGANLKLQYAVKSGSCDTGFVGESYVDVTSQTNIAYYNNFYANDGTVLTSNAGDPTHNPDTIQNQTYVESNNFTNAVSSIPSGQYGKWDFSLYDRGSGDNVSYCFRIINSGGSLLDTYTIIPEITTAIYVNRSGGSVPDIENPTTPANPETTGGTSQTGGSSIVLPKCSDTIDNDGDTFVDTLDSNCHLDGLLQNQYVPSWDSESVSPVNNTGGSQRDSGGDLGYLFKKVYSIFDFRNSFFHRNLLLGMVLNSIKK